MAASPQAVIPASGNGRPLPVRWLRRGLTLLLLAAVLALAGWCADRLRDPATLPIRHIRVQGNFVHLDEAMLREAVARMDRRGFFSIDIAAVKLGVEQLPWVARASVRRVWPDTLAIEVREQRALARWARGGLINGEGEPFAPPERSYPVNLPRFHGPRAMLPAMTEAFQQAQEYLLPAGLRIRELYLDSRRALRLRLDNGLLLMLGREHNEARLRGFVEVYERGLAARAAEIARVDLRYSNGMAVQWKAGSNLSIIQGGE